MSFGLTLQLTALLMEKERRYKCLIVQYLLKKMPSPDVLWEAVRASL